MAFTIRELKQLEPSLCHAVVDHNGQLLTVTIPAEYSRVSGLSGSFTAELDYHAVVSSEIGLPKDDSLSGLFSTEDSAVVIVDGSVHNHLEISADHILVDVYVQNGPEFIIFDSEELGGVVPPIDSRLRVRILGLRVYPTFTDLPRARQR